jgi:hypothetical protein
MGWAEQLDQDLRILVEKKLGVDHPDFEHELKRHQDALCDLLLKPLEALPVGMPARKDSPSPEILSKALKLQRLALESPSEHERNAAWVAFEKLWQKYELPPNLGM